jgi:hypothetical protein
MQLCTAQLPVVLFESIFKGVGNPHRGNTGDAQTAIAGTCAIASPGRYWLLEINCSTGSSSAAFRIISATNEQDGGLAMSIFAVDPVKVMVEATRTRLSDPMAKLMKDAKAEIKPLLLLQQGTTAVVGPDVSIKTDGSGKKTAAKAEPPVKRKLNSLSGGGDGPSTSSGKDSSAKIAKSLLLQGSTEVARSAGSSKTAPSNSKAAVENEPAAESGKKRKFGGGGSKQSGNSMKNKLNLKEEHKETAHEGGQKQMLKFTKKGSKNKRSTMKDTNDL